MPGWRPRPARATDAGELLVVGLAAFVSEAQRYGDPLLPPLRETLQDVRDALADPLRRVLVAEAGAWSAWRPDRLIGLLGAALVAAAEDAAAAAGAHRVELFTGAASHASLRLYERAGCRRTGATRVDDRGVELVVLAKPLPAGPEGRGAAPRAARTGRPPAPDVL